MPHFVVEYSSNLEERLAIAELCRLVNRVIMDTGIFELGAVRVRAYPARHYAVADGLTENSFIDMSFRIGKGRSEEEKRNAGNAIFAAVEAFAADLFKTPHFALSLEIREIDAELSWKRNAIHPRTRRQTNQALI